jgi:methylated-DNA-[protein]-cysteine S-methyltransferase
MNDQDGVLELDSPVGRILLAACEEGLTHLLFVDPKGRPLRTPRRPTGEASPAVSRILAAAERQLREYFARRRREFDLPLIPRGTEFQLAVWNGLRDIPFGETESYGELARRVGRAKAVRAVGAANGANPISIIVPCHRVIGRDRSLTGYGGGLQAKKTLLELEGATLEGDRLL